MHRCINSNNRWSPRLAPVLRIPHSSSLPGRPPPARSFPFPTPVFYPVEPPPVGNAILPLLFPHLLPPFSQNSFILPASLSLSTPISSVIRSSISSVHKALSLSIRVPPSLYTCPTLRLSYCKSGVRGSRDPLFLFFGHLTRAEHSTREDDTNKLRVHNPCKLGMKSKVRT